MWITAVLFLVCVSFEDAARLRHRGGLGSPHIAKEKRLLCAWDGETIPSWCSNWVDCIHDCGVPEGTASKVKDCWDPAPCQEYCGIWPESGMYNLLYQHPAAVTVVTLRKLNTTTDFTSARSIAKANSTASRDCMESCQNFQTSLSNCVATIIFQPGKIAVMKEHRPTQYQSFVGGCMEQLYAYHTATDPDAGSAALPGSRGCSVH